MALPLLAIMLQLLEEQRGSFLHLFVLSFVLLFISVFFLIRLHGAWSSPKKSNNLPPSPPKIPIIGNLHQIGTLPHRSFRDMSTKYGPLMLLQLGQFPTLVVSSAEMATEVMKNQDLLFATRPIITIASSITYGCTNVAFVPYGEYWRQARKICVLKLLSVKRVQSFKFVREEEVELAIKEISSSRLRGDSVNLSEILLNLTSDIVSRCAFGFKYKGVNKNRFGELSREVIGALGAFSFEEYFPSLGWMDTLTGLSGKIKRISQELDTFLDKVMDNHVLPKSQDHDQQEDRKDLVDSLLLVLKGSTNLTRDNIKAILVDLFVSGSDTSATVIEWAMAELIKNRVLMKKAQDEVRRVVGRKLKVDEDDINQMEYLKCIVKESLRLHAPVPTLVPREARVSTKIQGYDIPANTRVFINAWAIQRDSKLWDNPEEFHPERFINNPVDVKGQDFNLIPFGSGRRSCPGRYFAISVVEFALANLLYWFDWELPGGADGDELDMTEAAGLTANKKIPLHVVPTLHSAS